MRQFRAPEPAGPLGAGREPSLSVAIPAYNAAATIGQAIESVLAQTLAPHEIVVCDDGSTDDLDSALRPYVDEITLIRKENGGEGSSKKAASSAAVGDFIVILDADDAFLPERLEALAALARARPDLDILTTDAFFEVQGRAIRRCYTADWSFEVDDQRQTILERNFVFGAAAIRRSRLLAVGGFDESRRYAADWDLWIRMILSGSKVGLVDEPLYRYRVTRTALSSQRLHLFRGYIAVLESAAARPDLRPEERHTVETAIGARRREVLRLELREALSVSDVSQIRSRAAAIMRNRRIPLRTRLKSAATIIAPRTVARAERRRRGETWVGAGGVVVGGTEQERPDATCQA
jgi:glycosyltransferase involved in cell wall biosynthesis